MIVHLVSVTAAKSDVDPCIHLCDPIRKERRHEGEHAKSLFMSSPTCYDAEQRLNKMKMLREKQASQKLTEIARRLNLRAAAVRA